MKTNYIYIIAIALVFGAFTVIFTAFPRSTFSELERRELATFPEYSRDKLRSGDFTKEVSAWFSDSEPYRDDFMTMSMMVKDAIALKTSSDGEEAITIHEAAPEPSDQAKAKAAPGADPTHIEQFKADADLDQKTKVGDKGIIVVGSAPNARALMLYGAGKGGAPFADACNAYAQALPGVQVYCMVIPTSIEYYLPPKVKSKAQPMLPTINNIHSLLKYGVKPVNVYTTLGQHAKEDIFLRTDHHWAPLGAFYAAKEFAKVAGVPFRELSSYDKHVIHDFVGTMYGYSKDIAVKRSPEDFVYYTPRGVDYTTTYINFTTNKKYKITGEQKPVEGPFFMKYKDGSGMAYCTFMGGDTKIVQVKTGTKNGRKLLIVKDSFGNALPGYLFFSFEEIHVVDERYFTRNLKQYVKEHGVTDVLLASNIFRVHSTSVGKLFKDLLTQ